MTTVIKNARIINESDTTFNYRAVCYDCGHVDGTEVKRATLMSGTSFSTYFTCVRCGTRQELEISGD